MTLSFEFSKFLVSASSLALTSKVKGRSHILLLEGVQLLLGKNAEKGFVSCFVLSQFRVWLSRVAAIKGLRQV